MKVQEDRFFIHDKYKEHNAKFLAKFIVTSIQSVAYKIKLSTLSKYKNNKKYYVSICGIFKDEEPYLKEWIIYHKIAGADHIYLYNNNSCDGFRKIIEPFIEEGYVTLVEWPYNQKQMEAYKDCADKFGDETYWLGFIDIDEFIVPVCDNDIKEFLKHFEKRPSVLIYWKMFGTSGIVERNLKTLVTEQFTSCWPKYDDIGKCFLNTNYQISEKSPMLHHMLWAKRGRKSYPPVNCFDKPCIRDWFNPVKKRDAAFPIQINHYVLKSYQEYILKTQKSDVFFKCNPKGKEHFLRHELLCTDKDFKIYKYLIPLKNEINKYI